VTFRRRTRRGEPTSVAKAAGFRGSFCEERAQVTKRRRYERVYVRREGWGVTIGMRKSNTALCLPSFPSFLWLCFFQLNHVGETSFACYYITTRGVSFFFITMILIICFPFMSDWLRVGTGTGGVVVVQLLGIFCLSHPFSPVLDQLQSNQKFPNLISPFFVFVFFHLVCFGGFCLIFFFFFPFSLFRIISPCSTGNPSIPSAT